MTIEPTNPGCVVRRMRCRLAKKPFDVSSLTGHRVSPAKAL
jgi:hypothetical protein